MTATAPVTLTWDEPTGCSPRGWCYFTPESHPDRDAQYFDFHARTGGALVCGYYLDYTDGHGRGPDGAPVLARAYLNRVGKPDEERGCGWFWTPAEAKAWVERQVRHAVEG